MPSVLIRDVPSEDLEQIRAAARARGTSLQNYLREAVHAQAAYLRRQEALIRTAKRLRGGDDVPDDEREAVLDVIAAAHTDRAEQVSDRSER